jgi:ABC-type phosphate transport system substrate-binding protein
MTIEQSNTFGSLYYKAHKTLLAISFVVLAFQSTLWAQDLSISGTSTCAKAMSQIAAEFMKQNPGVSIKYNRGNSYSAVEGLGQREVDIAVIEYPLRKYVDRAWKTTFPKGTKPGAQLTFAQSPLGIIVNQKNKISKIQLTQLRKVLAGKVTRWRQVGGTGKRIRVLLCRFHSNTMVSDLLLHYRQWSKAHTRLQTDADVIASVMANPEAIGFVALTAQLPEGVKLLPVSMGKKMPYVQPTMKNFVPEKYPLMWQYQLIITEQAPDAARQFLDFSCGPEAAKIVEHFGLIPIAIRHEAEAEQRVVDMKTARRPVVAMAGGKEIAALADALAVDFVRAKEVIVPKYEGRSEVANVSRFITGRCKILVLDEPISAATQLRVKKKWQLLKPAEHVIAGSAVALVVNKANPIDSLTMPQIRKLYSGEVSDWSAIGGTPGKVNALATRAATNQPSENTARIAAEIFAEKALPDSDWKLVTRVKDPSAVLAAVATDRGAVGVVPLSMVSPDESGANGKNVNVKILGIKVGQGATASVVKPTPLNLQTARYPLSRQLTMYVYPKADPLTKRFAAFLATTGESAKNPYSDTMAAVTATFAKHGMVPLSKAAIAATKKARQQNATKPKSDTAGW